VRILVVPAQFPSREQPQSGIFILRRLEALAAMGHALRVLRIVPLAPPLTPKWRDYAKIPEYDEIAGIPVHTVRAPIPPRMIGIEFLPAILSPILAREIRAFDPDVIHASYLLPSGHLVASQRAVPSVVTSHGIDAHTWPHLRPGIRRACSQTVQRATRVTAVSAAIGAQLRGLADRPVDVVWNGADERYFFPRNRNECREILGIPPNRPVIAYAGNLLPVKGLDTLLAAIAQLRDLDPLLLIAGAGPLEAQLRTEASRLAIDARLLGRLDPHQLSHVYGAADAFTLPSRAEGLPNVVCEAMLCGRAVVASTAGGTPEILLGDRNGLPVPPDDATALAQALRIVCEDAALRLRLEQNARSFALENLTWRISARRYDRVLAEAARAA
jgi:teichuronic acid biosynthesis glycosyltransferase TuaC